MLIMPVRDFSDQDYKATIEDTEYTIFLSYNGRANSWYFGIGDAAGARIISGIKVVQGYALLQKHIRPGLPPGAFMMFFAGGDQIPRDGWISLGGVALLLYWTAEEVVELGTIDAPEVSLVLVEQTSP